MVKPAPEKDTELHYPIDFSKALMAYGTPNDVLKKIYQSYNKINPASAEQKIFNALGMPIVAAFLTAWPYNIAKILQSNAQTAQNNPLTSKKGLHADSCFLVFRYELRTIFVPYSTEYAEKNHPEWLSEKNAKILAGALNGFFADIALTATEFLPAAQRTYPGDKKDAPTLHSIIKADGFGAIKTLHKGLTPLAIRALLSNAALNATRVHVKDIYPDSKAAQIGAAAAAATVVNTILVPLSLIQTYMQQHNPLPLKLAIEKLLAEVKTIGIKAAYKGTHGRALQTLITALSTAAILAAQEEPKAKKTIRESLPTEKAINVAPELFKYRSSYKNALAPHHIPRYETLVKCLLPTPSSYLSPGLQPLLKKDASYYSREFTSFIKQQPAILEGWVSNTAKRIPTLSNKLLCNPRNILNSTMAVRT